MEDARKVEPLRFPVLDAAALVEKIGAADQIVEATDPELRHQLTNFLGNEEEIVDDVFRGSSELLAQLRILRRDADRACVQVALAHHDAAGRNERRRREA